MREKNKRDHHLFETTHPYFIELGLGSFTTGTLLDWWMQKDNNGNYLNRRHINPVNETDTTLLNPQKGLLDLLGISDADRENATDIHWYGWKPNVDTGLGAYKKQSLYEMIAQDKEIVKVILLLTGYIQGTKNKINDFLSKFSKFEWLWKKSIGKSIK